MVQYFWLFVKLQQGDWEGCQPIVHFVAKNRASETTIHILLYTLNRVDRLSELSESEILSQSRHWVDANRIQPAMRQIEVHQHVEMRSSKAIWKDHPNMSQITAPNIQEGTNFWLIGCCVWFT